MSTHLSLVVDNCLLLLIGATVILTVGCVVVQLHRAPIHRQRLGEMTIACCVVWLLLAVLPMRRPLDLAELATGGSVQEQQVEALATTRAAVSKMDVDTSLDSVSSGQLALVPSAVKKAARVTITATYKGKKQTVVVTVQP